MAAEDVAATGADPSELESGGLLHEIFTSPLNLLLLGLCIFLLYKIVRGDQPAASDSDDDEPPPLPRLKRRDFTPAELRRFDGVQDPRILMAINGKVFDVTKGRKFYGPGTAAGRGAAKTKEGAPARGWVPERRGGSGAPGEGLEWCPAWEGGAGRLPGLAGGQRRPRKAASRRDRRFPVRTASPGMGWRKKTEMLKPGVDGGVRSPVWKAEGGGWHRRAQCWGSFEGMGFEGSWKEGMMSGWGKEMRVSRGKHDGREGERRSGGPALEGPGRPMTPGVAMRNGEVWEKEMGNGISSRLEHCAWQ